MSSYIDEQYIRSISGSLDLFSWVRGNLANCRCPFCGDSARKKMRKRFYFIHGDANWRAFCHNCGYSNSFSRFLEEYDNSSYHQYRLDIFKDNHGDVAKEKPKQATHTLPDRLKALASGQRLASCTPVLELPESHTARLYLASRAIPESLYDRFWYSSRFLDVVKEFRPEREERFAKALEERLIIPFFDENQKLVALQGRDFRSDSQVKYITLKADDDVFKIYGLDRLKKDQPFYVMEGPINSMLIPNSIATCDANLLNASHVEGERIYLADPDYRNKHICGFIEKMIDSGDKVVLLPDQDGRKFDINDLLIDGMSVHEIVLLIKKHTYRGLAAKLHFGTLRKA